MRVLPRSAELSIAFMAARNLMTPYAPFEPKKGVSLVFKKRLKIGLLFPVVPRVQVISNNIAVAFLRLAKAPKPLAR